MNSLTRKMFRAAGWLERRYYRLNFWPRHVIGILVVCLLLAGAVGIGYCGYRGVMACYHLAVRLVENVSEFFEEEDIDDDEYSSTSKTHHTFPVPIEKRHPKRRPNFTKDFGFVNDVHLTAATALGITPLESREDIERHRDLLVELRDTRYYKVLPLTSSSPFLVPRAADFLTDLGRLMQEYSGTSSRFLISSVLRTQQDVAKLSRVNINAATNSTHCYGTTFDITYNRFDMHGNTWEGQLKEDLARALFDLQSMGYCYVKYEIKQPCFHVTVRP